MIDDKNIQNDEVALTSKKNETSSSQEHADNSTVQLSKDELDEMSTKKFNDLMKKHTDLERSVLKSFLKKYQIRESVKLSAINFTSVEDIEASLLNFCEKNNISYSKTDNNDIKVRESNVGPRTKKYFLL